MAFYYCNEDDKVYSSDELRNDFYALFDNEYETFENYLTACMWWNNGALKPLADHITALKRRLSKVLSLLRDESEREWYEDEITNLTAQIAHYEMYKEGI